MKNISLKLGFGIIAFCGLLLILNTLNYLIPESFKLYFTVISIIFGIFLLLVGLVGIIKSEV